MSTARRAKVGSILAALACAAGLCVVATPASAAEPLVESGRSTVVLPVNNRPAIDISFRTPALAGETTVRVMLPRNYDATGATRYPVLYLLHGGAATYRSWTAEGGIAQVLTDQLDLITVMPDAGRSAWYTDWYNNGAGGTPMWETFHIEQLIPWIDANFHTTGNRAGRAIAGLSSGGFGTMSYASRHPDLFVAAAAFSGALDTNTPPVVAGKVIDGLAAQDGGGPGSLFGLRETQEVRWRGHNPWDLATNLADMDLVVRAGNAFPGGGGPEPPWDFGGRFLERATYDQSVSFHERLASLGIEHEWDDYGPGSHNFYYWNRGLERSLPRFMQVFGERREDPSTFSYRSIEPSYDIYGWNVAMHRGVVEFSSFDDVSAEGFVLRGSGSATVTSAPVYTPGTSYDVTIAGETSRVAADAGGRLVLEVPLGAANLTQQYYTPSGKVPPTFTLPEAQSPLTTVYSTDVSIAAVEEPEDTTPPTISIVSPSEGEVFVLGQDASADFSCGDDDSGVATCDGGDIDTSTVGEHVITVNASDNAGNTASQTRTYQVVYDTDAFLAPVDDPPTINDASGNRAIPFKWTLRDAHGTSYASLEAEDIVTTWTPIDCNSRAPGGEAVPATSSEGPTYDAEAEQYRYTARVPDPAAGSCVRFTLALDDGSHASADFRSR